MKKKYLAGLAVSCFTALLSAQVTLADTFQGSTSGVFVNPVGGVNTGVGTSHFETGGAEYYGGTNSTLDFYGTALDVDADTLFSFGAVTFFNGSNYYPASAVDMDVTVNLTAPTGINQDFIYHLTFNNTSNVGTPEENADYLYLPVAQPLTSFSFNGTNYTLAFLGFGSIDNNGFVTTIDQFHVYEGFSASAQLFGQFTESTQPVPEPATMLLLGSGLAGLAGFRRKFKK